MDRRLALLIAITACGSSSEPTETKDKDQPKQGHLTVAGADLQLPAGSDGTGMKLVSGLGIPPNLTRFRQAIDDSFLILRMIEVTPKTATWTGPATLSTSVRGCPSHNAIAVALDPAGQPEVLPAKLVDDAKRLEVPLARNVAVAVLCPKNDKLIGTPAQLITGAPALIWNPDCSSYITPESPAIKALAADPKRFSVDPKGAITLDAKLELRTIAEGDELAKADQVLASGGGDRVSLAVVFASLFAAKNDPVMLVGGAVKSEKVRGVTAWAEVVVDGKPMYVDVEDPTHAKLVPLADAMTANNLEIHRGCAWYPPNTPNNANLFSVDAKPALQVTWDPAALAERRKLLDQQCNHGANKPACMERGKVDDELRKALVAMLAQHKELDAKCKLGKAPASCTERDRLDAQGKAIKALLDTKP